MTNTLPDWIETSITSGSPHTKSQIINLGDRDWTHYGDDQSLTYIELAAGGPDRILSITQTLDGDFLWSSSAIMINCEWYVRAHGRSATPEAAAEEAVAYRNPIRHIGVHDWIGGTDEIGRTTWETRIGEEVTRVTQSFNRTEWGWSRRVCLDRFRSIGISLLADEMSGWCETAEDAMAAALEAPTLLRAACRAYLAETGPLRDPQSSDTLLEAA